MAAERKGLPMYLLKRLASARHKHAAWNELLDELDPKPDGLEGSASDGADHDLCRVYKPMRRTCLPRATG